MRIFVAGSPYPNNPRTTAYMKAPRNIWPIINDPSAGRVPVAPKGALTPPTARTSVRPT